MRGRALFGLFAAGSLLVGAPSAFAQGSGGVASSGMGQGEASISTRSDVRMGVESGPGTSGRRLQLMVDAITVKLGQVRQCYGQVTGERPNVTGEMTFRVTLPRRGRAQLGLTENTTEDRPLLRCVREALERASFRGAMRPAVVFVDLGFGNTAAAGAEEVARRRAVEDNVRVRRDERGRFLAIGGTPGGEVRFTAISEDSELTAQLQRVARATIPSMLDCRRRAGRRHSPEGLMVLELRIQRRGVARTRPVENTIRDSRAHQCVARAFRRADFSGQTGTALLRVAFAPTPELDVATIPE